MEGRLLAMVIQLLKYNSSNAKISLITLEITVVLTTTTAVLSHASISYFLSFLTQSATEPSIQDQDHLACRAPVAKVTHVDPHVESGTRRDVIVPTAQIRGVSVDAHGDIIISTPTLSGCAKRSTFPVESVTENSSIWLFSGTGVVGGVIQM